MKAKAKKFLKEYFGYETFLAGQELIINSVLDKKNTLGIMPTGGGKSLCYQIPALCFSGLTIVISPLISLMKDQIDYLHKVNYPADMINSTVSYDSQLNIKRKLERNEIKLLYLTPERFKNKNFLSFITRLKVSCFTIDEAHCISEWGHDFRPEYRKLSSIIEMVNNPVVLALTATATSLVKDDIITSLKMNDANSYITGFNRNNLIYNVEGFVAQKEKNTALLNFINNIETPGIIYTSSVKDALLIYNYLATNSSKKIVRYHGGLSSGERKKSQEDFLSDKADVLVATNAFGMGVNKENIRFVIHYSIPGSIEAYYQETGRAGRDGKVSKCLLLSMEDDERIQDFFIKSNNPSIELINECFKVIVKESRKKVLYIDGVETLFEGSKINSFVLKVILKQLHHFECIDYEYRVSDLIEVNILNGASASDKETVIELFSERINSTSILSVSKDSILKRTGHDEKELFKILNELAKNKSINWHLVKKGRVLKILKDKISEKTEKNYKEKLLKKIEFDKRKLKYMSDYTVLSSCRRKYLLNYFGEDYKEDNCGMCDVCLGTKKNYSEIKLDSVHKALLLFFYQHNSKIGKVKSLKILSGSYELEPNYRDWDEYGMLRKTPFAELENRVNILLKAKFLETEKGKYPVIKITKDGIKELKYGFK